MALYGLMHITARFWIKVVDHPVFGTKWLLRSHFIWWKWRKQRVPKGYVLHHKDEDCTHDVLSNLRLLTRAEHARLHTTKRVWSEESRARASIAAQRRCTSEWKAAVSALVKLQYKQGKLGRATWSEEAKASAGKKLSAAFKGRPNGQLGRKATSEQRTHYKQAALLREERRRKGELSSYTGARHWAFGKPSARRGKKVTPEQRIRYKQQH